MGPQCLSFFCEFPRLKANVSAAVSTVVHGLCANYKGVWILNITHVEGCCISRFVARINMTSWVMGQAQRGDIIWTQGPN